MKPNETDELAAAGLHVVSAEDEDADIEDIKPKSADTKETDEVDGAEEEALSDEEAERQDALADFMPEEDEI